jgi:tRNA dimethylallyltransferase
MFQSGLIDEVKFLLERFGCLSRTAAQAVGYREVLDWIGTDQSIEDLREEVSAHTRQLARRQETWFRSFREITPVQCHQQKPVIELVDELVQAIEKRREAADNDREDAGSTSAGHQLSG